MTGSEAERLSASNQAEILANGSRTRARSGLRGRQMFLGDINNLIKLESPDRNPEQEILEIFLTAFLITSRGIARASRSSTRPGRELRRYNARHGNRVFFGFFYLARSRCFLPRAELVSEGARRRSRTQILRNYVTRVRVERRRGCRPRCFSGKFDRFVMRSAGDHSRAIKYCCGCTRKKQPRDAAPGRG